MASDRAPRDFSATFEDGLGSKGRLRILRTLGAKPSGFFTKYALEKVTGIRSRYLKVDLEVLVSLGWVVALPTTPVKYQLNARSVEAGQIMDFFRKVGYL